MAVHPVDEPAAVIPFRRGMPLREFRAMITQRNAQPCTHPFESVTREFRAKRLKTVDGKIALIIEYHCGACGQHIETDTKTVKT